MIAFEEAVHGLRRPGATMFPQAIALAATWDTALIGRAALAMARETRSRGIRMVLSPVVNLASDVRWGRVGHFHTGGVPGRREIDAGQELNYRAVATAIADLGFQGYVAHEFVPSRDPLTSLAEAVRLMDV